MSDIKRNFKVSAKGVLNIDAGGRMTISVEDEGDYDLSEILEDFDGREIKLQVTYDEDYGVDMDESTGEIIE
jgi:hypothetical protein